MNDILVTIYNGDEFFVYPIVPLKVNEGQQFVNLSFSYTPTETNDSIQIEASWQRSYLFIDSPSNIYYVTDVVKRETLRRSTKNRIGFVANSC